MADAGRRLRATERAAADARRALEAGIVNADEGWNDSARRGFEADHLAAIRADARHLHVELGAIAALAEAALRNLG